MTSFWTNALVIMKDAESLGIIGKMRFGGCENSQAEALLKVLGPTAEGYIAPSAAPRHEEVELLIDMHMRYHGKLDLQGDEASSLVWGPLVVGAINRAIEKLCYENLDGRAVEQAVDGIKDLNPIGIKKLPMPQRTRGAPRR